MNGEVDVTVETINEVNVTIEAIASAVDSLPAGWIRIFLGSVQDIPLGWLLCDGANGTPDLRGMFLKGAPQGAPSGGVGGSPCHQHSLDMCSYCCGCHDHWVGGDTTWDAGCHSHSVYGEACYGYHYHCVYGCACPCYCDYIEVDYGYQGYYASCCYHGHTICGYTDCDGHCHGLCGYTDCGGGYHWHELAGYTTYDGDHCHRVCGSVYPGSNLPPYYEVLFIMKA